MGRPPAHDPGRVLCNPQQACLGRDGDNGNVIRRVSPDLVEPGADAGAATRYRAAPAATTPGPSLPACDGAVRRVRQRRGVDDRPGRDRDQAVAGTGPGDESGPAPHPRRAHIARSATTTAEVVGGPAGAVGTG